VCRTPMPCCPGHYSSIFTRPKKNGGLRLVFNLKRLNRCVQVQKFKMETLVSIRESLRKADWTVTLDLEDAYYHIAIHPSQHHLLRFVMNGVVHHFQVLPFGLSTAPWLFTKLLRPVLAFCHVRGLRTHAYLDDWLIRDQNRHILLKQLSTLLPLLYRLGLGVNVAKSRFIPQQKFTFLGTFFDTTSTKVYPTPERFAAIKQRITSFLERPDFTIRLLCQLIGILDATAAVVPFGHWRVRPLHWYRKEIWDPCTGSYEDVFPLNQTFPRRALLWWTKARNVTPGVPLHEPTPDLTLYTDASLDGWGAHLLEHRVSGTWTPAQRRLHINVLELKAVDLALQALLPVCRNKVIQVQADNTTAVAYLKRGGGTH